LEEVYCMTRQEFEHLLRCCGPHVDIDDCRIERVIGAVIARIKRSGARPVLDLGPLPAGPSLGRLGIPDRQE
jgi:hypothetical protein